MSLYHEIIADINKKQYEKAGRNMELLQKETLKEYKQLPGKAYSFNHILFLLYATTIIYGVTYSIVF